MRQSSFKSWLWLACWFLRLPRVTSYWKPRISLFFAMLWNLCGKTMPEKATWILLLKVWKFSSMFLWYHCVLNPVLNTQLAFYSLQGSLNSTNIWWPFTRSIHEMRANKKQSKDSCLSTETILRNEVWVQPGRAFSKKIWGYVVLEDDTKNYNWEVIVIIFYWGHRVKVRQWFKSK